MYNRFEQKLLKEYFYYNPLGLLCHKNKVLNPKPCKFGYKRITVSVGGKKKKYLYHRVCWFLYYGYWPKEVDHRDRKPSNNKIYNLREVDRVTNLRNRNPSGWSTSGYKGVSKHRNRWLARVNNKYVGYYRCPTVAYFSIIKLTPREEGF